MNWIEKENAVVSGKYTIYSGIQGFSVWIYGKQSGCLGSHLPTMKAAKELAEKNEQTRDDKK